MCVLFEGWNEWELFDNSNQWKERKKGEREKNKSNYLSKNDSHTHNRRRRKYLINCSNGNTIIYIFFFASLIN
jgi:hypothetical protein